MTHIPQSGGPQAPYGLYIMQGYYNNLDGIHKYGFNPDVDATYETIWEKGGAYTFPGSATTVTVAANALNANRKLRVVGLDANYDEIEEVFTLDGTGAGATQQSFLRINRAHIAGNTNLGAAVDLVVDTQVAAYLSVEHQNTLQMVYTVPAGYTAYIFAISGGNSKTDKDVEMRVREFKPNGVYRTRELIGYESGTFDKTYQIPVMVEEKQDLTIEAKCSGNNATISAGLDIILEKN